MTTPNELVLTKSELLKPAEQNTSSATSLLSEVWQRGSNQVTQRPVETLLAVGAGAALVALRPWRLLSRAGAAKSEGASLAAGALSRNSLPALAIESGAIPRASNKIIGIAEHSATTGTRPGLTSEFDELIFGKSPASRAYWAKFESLIQNGRNTKVAQGAGDLTINSPFSHASTDALTSCAQTLNLAAGIPDRAVLALTPQEIKVVARLGRETVINHSSAYALTHRINPASSRAFVARSADPAVFALTPQEINVVARLGRETVIDHSSAYALKHPRSIR